jgi:hypothetical protein
MQIVIKYVHELQPDDHAWPVVTSVRTYTELDGYPRVAVYWAHRLVFETIYTERILFLVDQQSV